MTTVLDRILAYKRDEIAAARRAVPDRDLERRCADLPPTRRFRAALERGPEIRIIAEVKRASPSAGVIRAVSDPVAIAKSYEDAGAACISVLTDGPSFQGSLADLVAVRAAVSIPVLRKDFMLDRYQLLEARAAGADCILLIAEALEGDALSHLLNEAQALGLEALVELYDAENLPRVLASGARLVGVNNRDLRTFEVSLSRTLSLAPAMPADVCLVSESGIKTRADVERLKPAGVRAILVGETLMRSKNVAVTMRELSA